jgi:type II secretory pathway component PulC
MSTARLKFLTWTVATVLGVALLAYIGLFLRSQRELMAPVEAERMAQVLGDVPEPASRVENMVDRDKFEAALRKYDWTGKPPAKPVEVEQAPEPVAAGPEPVSKFLKLRGIKIDAAEPQYGEVVFKYTSDAKVTTVQSADGTVRKQVGTRLDAPLSYIYVESITEAGVEFAFDDSKRSHEFLTTNDFPLEGGYVILGDEIVATASVPREQIPISTRVRGPQPKTEMISPNKFRIGFEDAQYIDENYSTILAEEINYTRHRDPKTGKFDGIEIKSVKPGSVAANHGVQSGDVIKSINGHPVSSTSDAIQFVKTHKNDYDVWEVEVVNKGQTRIVTYYPPSNN